MIKKIIAGTLILTTLCLSGCAMQKTNSTIRFALIADPQLGFSSRETYDSTDLDYLSLAITKINQLENPAEFALILGDMVQNQGDEIQQWPDYQKGIKNLTIPYYEVMGNHDGWNPKGLDRWRHRWGKRDFYSFTHKGVYFMALNSYFLKRPLAIKEETVKQKSFIKTELDKQDANPHKFIFHHFPLYLKDPQEAEDGNRNLPINERQFLLGKIEQHKVKAVFSGHAHYQIVHQYKGTTLLTANPTSRTLGKGKRGFYVVDYNKTTGSLSWQFIHLT